jgi:hypothetical protein
MCILNDGMTRPLQVSLHAVHVIQPTTMLGVSPTCKQAHIQSTHLLLDVPSASLCSRMAHSTQGTSRSQQDSTQGCAAMQLLRCTRTCHVKESSSPQLSYVLPVTCR